MIKREYFRRGFNETAAPVRRSEIHPPLNPSAAHDSKIMAAALSLPAKIPQSGLTKTRCGAGTFKQLP